MANQVWQITAPSVVSLATLSETIPKPGPHQSLIRIHAVSLNFRDILVTDHSPAYPVKNKTDLIPCSDAAGVIEEAGEGSVWKKGDKVVLLANTWFDGDNRNFSMNTVLGAGDADGTLRRWIVFDDARIVRAPSNLSHVEASTLFTAGLTAYRALFFGLSNTAPGTTLLTQGTGGVSCFAIQLGAAAGAKVVATSSSDEKLATAKKLGATSLVNYRTNPEWADEVLRLTDGQGVDHVLEVGGSGTIEQSLKATRQSGVVTAVGILTEGKSSDLIPAILFGDKTVSGQLGAGNKKMFISMIEFVEKHDIHPVVAKAFEFEEAKEALEYTKHLSEVGKVVIKC